MRTGHKKTTIFDTTTRSALEARWAIFFRELNLKWRYEPTKLNGKGCFYTPDFHVEGLGYIEIKPTIRLLIEESANRISKVAVANPDINIYCFCADHVELGSIALYHGDKIYAPSPQHMYGIISYARVGGDRLSIVDQDADIKRAMRIANKTKLTNEWQSTADILPNLIDGILRGLEQIETLPVQ